MRHNDLKHNHNKKKIYPLTPGGKIKLKKREKEIYT